jgi:hypothetical protein
MADQASGDPDASAAVNLAIGGDFSQDGSAWHLLGGSNATFAVMGNHGCMTGQSGAIGWPSPPAPPAPADLAQGSSYTLSYTASVMGAPSVTVEAKVGQSNPPYNADLDSPNDVVGTSPTSFTHQFTVTAMGGDPMAGISLSYYSPSPVTLCFSDVVLAADP